MMLRMKLWDLQMNLSANPYRVLGSTELVLIMYDQESYPV